MCEYVPCLHLMATYVRDQIVTEIELCTRASPILSVSPLFHSPMCASLCHVCTRCPHMRGTRAWLSFGCVSRKPCAVHESNLSRPWFPPPSRPQPTPTAIAHTTGTDRILPRSRRRHPSQRRLVWHIFRLYQVHHRRAPQAPVARRSAAQQLCRRCVCVRAYVRIVLSTQMPPDALCAQVVG